MSAIGGDVSVQNACLEAAEGNFGALDVLVQYVAWLEKDGADVPGIKSRLRDLPSAGVTCDRVWGLYKDVCGNEIEGFASVLEAWGNGQLSADVLQKAIDNRGKGFDVKKYSS
jgi:hypothetical protein